MDWTAVIGDVVQVAGNTLDDFTFTEEEQAQLATQREGYAAARDVAASQLKGVALTADARRTGALAQMQAAVARAGALEKVAYAAAAAVAVVAVVWVLKQ